jgi:RNA polymerase sigma-70 factor (ECF subfamily)
LTLSERTSKNAVVKANPSGPASRALPGLLVGTEAEPELIRRARSGDREAFGRLVERHQDPVMTACYYLTGDREDAEDLTQEVFLRAYRSLGGFAGESSFRTWLLTIATNAARSLAARRKAKKRTAHEVRIEAGAGGEPLEIAEADGRGSPEGRAERVEIKEALEAAIAALDEESRAVVVMRDLAGESYQAIALALGLSLGTVKSRIHRARLELRERLRDLL